MTPNGNTELCHFAGLVIGKALLEGIPISAKLNWLLIKELINQAITLEDVKYYDPQLYKSFTYLVDKNCDFESLCLTFAV